MKEGDVGSKMRQTEIGKEVLLWVEVRETRFLNRQGAKIGYKTDDDSNHLTIN